MLSKQLPLICAKPVTGERHTPTTANHSENLQMVKLRSDSRITAERELRRNAYGIEKAQVTARLNTPWSVEGDERRRSCGLESDHCTVLGGVTQYVVWQSRSYLCAAAAAVVADYPKLMYHIGTN